MRTAVDEQRRHDRHPARLPVHFAFASTVVNAFSRDLSLGGMFVETDVKVPVGTVLQLELAIAAPDGPFALDATVRWTAAGGIGVQFAELGVRTTRAIHAVIRG